jgi:hypothetical protein
MTGSYNVTMSVDRKHDLVKMVTLGAGESTEVCFELKGSTGGLQERTFMVYLDE